jgi:2-polyprenyl-3-methyl-5-hydroxy-6-metoxy-1,4-benzoquinol methylase
MKIFKILHPAIIMPPKFREIHNFVRGRRGFTLLDVGCGNHSPTITKKYYPYCKYHGADIADDYNLNVDDKKLMDNFYLVDTEGGGYENIQDNYYDVVVMNHVVEHMKYPIKILSLIVHKVAPGGLILIAFPSEKSLSLPSANIGTLNFSDDITHIYLPSLNEICNVLLMNGFKIVFEGETKDRLRWIMGFIKNLYNKMLIPIGMKLSAKYLWYYLGFETSIIAIKRKK